MTRLYCDHCQQGESQSATQRDHRQQSQYAYRHVLSPSIKPLPPSLEPQTADAVKSDQDDRLHNSLDEPLTTHENPVYSTRCIFSKTAETYHRLRVSAGHSRPVRVVQTTLQT